MKLRFELENDDLKKLRPWIEAKGEVYTGAIRGRFTYIFTPTTLGVIAKVKDNFDGSEIDLTDYESW